MPLTVRLDETLLAALESYAAYRRVTKSHVVQESLAVYLAEHQAGAPAAKRGAPSGNLRAFEAAGLVGAGESAGRSATKPVVRERALERLKRSSRGAT